jgi:hypothetical protein
MGRPDGRGRKGSVYDFLIFPSLVSQAEKLSLRVDQVVDASPSCVMTIPAIARPWILRVSGVGPCIVAFSAGAENDAWKSLSRFPYPTNDPQIRSARISVDLNPF